MVPPHYSPQTNGLRAPRACGEGPDAGSMSLVDARVVVGSEATPGEREERVRDYVIDLEAGGYERG